MISNRQVVGVCKGLVRSMSSKKHPRPLRTKKYGIDILHDPLWNKSLAFDTSERDRLGLRGLLPPATRCLETQVRRNMERLRAMPSDITKNLYLQDLHNRNETLYHRVLVDHVSILCIVASVLLTLTSDRRAGAAGLHADRRHRVPAVRPALQSREGDVLLSA